MAFSGSFGATGVGGFDEIAAIRRELEQIRDLMAEMRPDLEKAPHQLSVYRELVQVARTYLLLANRMGLPEDAEKMIRIGQRIIVIFNQMYRAGMLLFTSPVGAVIGVGSLALSQLYIMEGY